MAPTPEPEASGAVGFLDLPPEIRNTVYELTLIVRLSEPIVSIGCLRPDLGRIKRHVVSDRLWPQLAQNDTMLGLAPNLLVSCKQVHQEAIPVLYGNNPFLIAADSKKVKYPRSNGRYQFPPLVQAMRTVQLQGNPSQAAVRSVLLALQNMLDLNTLRISASLRRNFRVPHTMASALSPLVQGMHKERKGTDRKQAMDVIEFRTVRPQAWVYHEMTPAFAEEVQEILRRSLDRA